MRGDTGNIHDGGRAQRQAQDAYEDTRTHYQKHDSDCYCDECDPPWFFAMVWDLLTSLFKRRPR